MKRYKMTDLGPASQFLGLEISRDRESRPLHLHQSTYIKRVLKRFKMDQCNGVSTPMESNARLHATDERYIALENDILEYQQALGSIMYAMLGTWPDLAYPISSLSKFSVNPSFEHAAAVHHIFRYLRKTVNVGITFDN